MQYLRCHIIGMPAAEGGGCFWEVSGGSASWISGSAFGGGGEPER